MSDSDAGDSTATFEAALQARMVDDLGMSLNAAKVIARHLAGSDGPVLEQAQRWLDDGTVPSMEADGLSIEEAVRQGLSKNPVSALVLMDNLRHDPVGTRRRLARGHDEIHGLPGSDSSGT